MGWFNSAYNRKYLSVAMPAALEGIFMTVLQAADLVMVGTLGSAAIAAVSIFMPLRLVLLTFARSLASSITILTATKFGAGDTAGIKALLRQSLTITILVMGIIHLGFFCFFEEIVKLMGAKADYLQLAIDYGLIATLAVFISCLSLAVQAIQLGIGSTSMIMKSNVAGNMVNICCNYVLITGLGSFPGWGVRGAAIGTVIGSLVTLGITLWIMGKISILPKVFFSFLIKAFGKNSSRFLVASLVS